MPVQKVPETVTARDFIPGPLMEAYDNIADSAALQLVLKSRELWQNGLPIEVKIDDSTCVLFSRFMTP